MVSRRNFISITVMMLVLLCMFQAPQIVKDKMNQYEVNTKLHDSHLTQDDAWVSSTAMLNDEILWCGLFVGDEDSSLANMVQQWGQYNKKSVVMVDHMTDYVPDDEMALGMIFVDPSALKLEDVAVLKGHMEDGVTIIFCDLPRYEDIAVDAQLRDLLGIKDVVQPKVKVEGYHMYSGFLLGGEVLYAAQDKADEERQDMALELPWYRLGAGTEVFMLGLLDEAYAQQQDLKREAWPPVIWSHSDGNGKVFAVNGNFMENGAGLGLVSAMMYHAQDFLLYPVVDAQLFSAVNFPNLSNENQVYLNQKFGANMSQICRDVIYTQLLSTAEMSRFKMNWMVQPQYDYSGDTEPTGTDYFFYLKEANERGTEVGLSMDVKAGTAIAAKIEKDQQFFDSIHNNYQFGAVYATKDELADVLSHESDLKDLHTVLCHDEAMESVVGYGTRETTILSITNDGYKHSYMDDLRMRSLQTALAYTHVALDMNRILWPEEGEESWEILSGDFSRNIYTYWNPFQNFSDATASEADLKVREFLTMDYHVAKTENTITVAIENLGSTTSFLLRTHGEEIESMTGGSYEKVEPNVYLIRASYRMIRIELKDALLSNQ